MPRPHLAFPALLFVLCSTGSMARPADAQRLLDQWPGQTGGAVNAITTIGNTAYISGNFTNLGKQVGSLAILDGSTAAVLKSLPYVGADIRAVAPDGAGGWYIGGSFTNIGGLPRGGLAHINPDMSIGSWAPRVSAFGVGTHVIPIVRSLAISGSTVFVAGTFDSINGLARPLLAAIDGNSGALVPVNFQVGADPFSSIYAMILSGSTLYVGDDHGVKALDANTGNAPWITGTTGSGSMTHVRALALDGSTLYVGGSFTGLGGFSRNRIGAVNASTGAVSAWNPNADADVLALAVQGGTVFAGGSFGAIGGEFRSRIAALSTAGAGSATAWNPGTNGEVSRLAIVGSKVVASGDFQFLGGQPRAGLGAVETASGLVSSWLANESGSFIQAFGTDLVVGRLSNELVYRRFLAAFDMTTGAPTSWDPSPDGQPFALATDGAAIYVGCSFTSMGRQSRNFVAALSPTTGAALPWSPQLHGSPSFNYVETLAVDGSVLYVGGGFTMVSGTSRPYIAAFDIPTGNLTSWNPIANNKVRIIRPAGSTVYVAGDFTAIGGSPRSLLAALDATSGSALSWNPSPSPGPVTGISLDATNLYVSGAFTSIGGAFRNRLAAVDRATGVASSFDPNPSGNVGGVFAANGKVYATLAGAMTIGGQSRNGLAELLLPNGNASAWKPSLTGANSPDPYGSIPYHLAGSTLIAGGRFSTLEWRGSILRSIVGFDLSQPPVAVEDRDVDRVALSVAPNPSRGSLRIRLAVPSGANVRVRVLDVQGREVSRPLDGWTSGAREVVWDGLGPQGRVPAGLYFVRAEMADRTVVARVAMVR